MKVPTLTQAVSTTLLLMLVSPIQKRAQQKLQIQGNGTFITHNTCNGKFAHM